MLRLLSVAFGCVLLAVSAGCVKEREVTVEVIPPIVNLGPGGQFTFNAVQSGTFNATVDWSVVDGPWKGTIDANGTFIAADPVVAGDQITIRATSSLYPNVFGDSTVTVVLQVEPPAGPLGGGNLVRVLTPYPNDVDEVTFGGVPGTDLRPAGTDAVLVAAPPGAAMGPVDVHVDYNRGDRPLLDYVRGYKYRVSFLRYGGSTALPGPDGILSVAVGDFDGDSELELAGGTDLGAMGVIDNVQNSPTLLVNTVFPGPIDILRSGDIDGDGRDEMIGGWWDPTYDPEGAVPVPGAIGIVFFKDGLLDGASTFDRIPIPDWGAELAPGAPFNGVVSFEVGDVDGDDLDDVVVLLFPPDPDSAVGQLLIAPQANTPFITPAVATIQNVDQRVATSLALEDLDGDGTDEIILGYAMLITAGSADTLLSVHQWDGNAFQIIQTVDDPVTESNSALRVITGDFNGDTYTDVITVPQSFKFQSTPDAVMIPGNAAGGFDAPIANTPTLLSEPTGYLESEAALRGVEEFALIAGFFTTNTRAVDLNGDGYDDIPLLVDLPGVGDEGVMGLINQQDNTFDLPVHTMLGGWFAPETAFRNFSPTRAEIADLDGNGTEEFIYSRWSYRPELGRFQILDTTAFDAAPANQALFGTPGRAMEIADLDGVNGPDVVALVNVDNLLTSDALEVQVQLADGAGNFTAATPIVLTDPGFDVEVADMNGDTFLDVIVSTSAGVVIHHGDGAGAFTAQAPLEPLLGATHILVKDLDFDLMPDIAAIGADFNLYILRTTKGGGALPTTLAEADTLLLGGQPNDLAAADVDGDGDFDIVIAGAGATGFAVVRLDPKPTSTEDYTVELPDLSIRPRTVALADLDADGKAEAVISDDPSVVTVVNLLPGLGIESSTTIFTGLDDKENCPIIDPDDAQFTTSLELADMDLDGLLDLLVGYGNPNCIWVQSDVAVLPGQRGGGFSTPLQYFGVDFPVEAHAGDFNADGKVDVGLMILKNGSAFYTYVTTESGVVLLTNTSE